MTLDVTTMRARVANLDCRPDRWARFTQIDTGLPNLQRFSAINASTMGDLLLNSEITESTKIRIVGRTRRSHEEIDARGAVGCSLSHITMWQEFSLDPDPNVTHMIVFEDDTNLEPFRAPGSLAQYLQSMIDLLPSETWDVWLSGYNRLRDCSPWDTPQATPKIARTVLDPNAHCKCQADFLDIRSFFGTHCYIITREGAQKMIANALPIESHIDGYMSRQAQLGRVRIIASGDPFHLTNSMCDTDITHGSALICSLGMRDASYKIVTYVLIVLLVVLIIALIVQVRYGKSIVTYLREKLHCPMNPKCRGAQICSLV